MSEQLDPKVVVRINRYEGGHQDFFGSDLKQSGGVSIEIAQASSSESFGEQKVFGGLDTLIQVKMTHSQFAQLITTLNNGTGTPATLTRFNNREVKEFVNETTVIERHRRHLDETKDRLKERVQTVKDIINEIGNIKGVSKKVKEKLDMALKMVLQEYESNIPFVFKQVEEDMETVVQRGMGDIECYLETRLNQLGKQALVLLADNKSPLLMDDKDKK